MAGIRRRFAPAGANTPPYRDETAKGWGTRICGSSRRLRGCGLPEGDGGAGGVGEDGHPAVAGDLLRAADDGGSEAGGLGGGCVDVVDTNVGEPAGGGAGHGEHSAAGAVVGFEHAVDHAAAHVVVGDRPVEELGVEVLGFGEVGGGELEVYERVCHECLLFDCGAARACRDERFHSTTRHREICFA
jgi:hypothetical protein